MSHRICPPCIGWRSFNGQISPSTVAERFQCTQPMLVDSRCQSGCKTRFTPIHGCFIQWNHQPRGMFASDQSSIDSPSCPILESGSNSQATRKKIRLNGHTVARFSRRHRHCWGDNTTDNLRFDFSQPYTVLQTDSDSRQRPPIARNV